MTVSILLALALNHKLQARMKGDLCNSQRKEERL